MRAILIVECDASTLARQGITTATEIAAVASTAAPETKVVFVRATAKDALLEKLSTAARDVGRFDLVVLIGHSNTSGLKLFDGPLVPWAVVAEWLAPFAPRQIVLVACEAGRWLPCDALFRGIRSLREIFGSPLKLDTSQAATVKVLVPFLAYRGRFHGDTAQRILQVANFALTGGVIFRQTRREFTRTDASEGVVWTVIEHALGGLVPLLRRAIGQGVTR